MAELSDWRVADIERQLRRLYPSLPYSALRPLMTVVADKLRAATVDIYELTLSSTRNFGDDAKGYFSYREVELNGTIVFIRLRVD
jgi:hypothetical protein